MKLAVIGAMEEEVTILRSKLEHAKQKQSHTVNLQQANMKEQKSFFKVRN